MKIQTIAAVGVISVLGACGGGSSGDGLPSFESVDDAVAAAAAAQDRIDAFDLTPLAEIPTTGSATYEGVIAINDEDATDAADASVLGGVAITLDFADAANATGTAGNFLDTAGTPVDGTLTFSNFGYAQGTNNGSVTAELDGQLANVGRTGTDADYIYDMQGGGLFQGDNAAAITLLMNGAVSEVGGTVDRQVTGAFNVERQ